MSDEKKNEAARKQAYRRLGLSKRLRNYIIADFVFLAVILLIVSTLFVGVVTANIYRETDSTLATAKTTAVYSAVVSTETDADGNVTYSVTQSTFQPGEQLYYIYYIDGVPYLTNEDFYSYLINDYYRYFQGHVPGQGGIVNPALESEYEAAKAAVASATILAAEDEKPNTIMTEAIRTKNDIFYFRTITLTLTSTALAPVTEVKILIDATNVVTTQHHIIEIYFLCLIIDFLIIGLGSLLLASQTIKPLTEALDRQMAFVGDASHELRTPLAIVQANLENVFAQPQATVEDVSEEIASSLKEIERLSKMTNELLDLASSDKNAVTYKVTEFNLGDLARETCAPFAEMATLQEKTFTMTLSEVTIAADADRIRQVMIILLDNALKYSDKGDSITVTVADAGADAVFTVADTGKGISAEALPHVFERFYREDKARSRAIQGNGLGLSIALSLVKKHHGTITAAHNEPKGTIFTVTLPKKNRID